MSSFGKFAGFHNNNYLAAYDTTTQSISATGEVFFFRINTVDVSSGITITNGGNNSKIVFSKAGVYNIQFSAQVSSSNASDSDVYFWTRINGVDVPYSNTKYDIAGGSKAQVVILNYVYRLNKDDYVQICWSDSTNVSLLASLSSTAPNKPAIPSIILTCWEIGAY